MGGHGHGEPYKIPDYKIYKVEDIPELMATKRALESQGLRDPWLRNEVWRYVPSEFGTEGVRAKLLLLKGFKWGLGAAVLTVTLSKLYDMSFPSDHGHGHGHKE